MSVTVGDPRALLRIVSSAIPGLQGREVELGAAGALIGRATTCDVVLKHPDVSRRHARVESSAGGFRVVDLGSANGVFVGAQRVDSAQLASGMRFRVSGTVFEYEGPAPASPDAAETAGAATVIGIPALSLQAPAGEAPPATPAMPAGGEREAREPPGAAVPTPPRPPEFVVSVSASKAGETPGHQARVENGSAVVGREEGCTLELAHDSSVSRQHARVEWVRAGRFRVTDLNSANGVWMGDQRVAEVEVGEGEAFRVGDTFLECQTVRATAATQEMSDLDDLMAAVSERRLLESAEAISISGRKAVLLDDPRYAYYVASGKAEIFTVTVRDGRPLGGRSHFASVSTGQAFFGMESALTPDSGFLAVGKGSTDVRRLERSNIERLCGDPHLAARVGALVDDWVQALSAHLARSVHPRPEVRVELTAGQPTDLPAGERARAAEGVLWLSARPGSLIFAGMSTLQPEAPDTAFPLTPQAWVERTSHDDELPPLLPRTTRELLSAGGLWAALDHFHQVLAECEFINKRLAMVDEYQRLESKARESEAARDAAFDAIGAVLAGQPAEAAASGGSGRLEPVVAAARLVARAMGIAIKPPVDTPAEASFHEHVVALATASGCRARRVALRGDWWRQDVGPLLARQSESGAPVALIPRGACAYRWVDPSVRTAVPVTAALANTLSPFAYSLYRPFPAGALGPKGLLRFGIRGLAPDLVTIVVLGLATGLLGAAVPFLAGQVVDNALPQAERGLLFQLGLAMLLTAFAGLAFHIVESVAVVRAETRMDYTLQAALWDRLLELPTSFFRGYEAGDLAERAAGINAIRGLLSRSGVGAMLGALSSSAYLLLMLLYSAELTLVAVGLTALLVGGAALGSALQLRAQRRDAELSGRLASLVFQLVAGVAKVRVSGAENHAFRVWAERFSDQRRVAFSIGRIQNVLATFTSGFQLLATLVLFAAIQSLQSEGASARFSTGTFVAFFAAFGSFVGAVRQVAESALAQLAILPLYERLRPILTTSPESDESKSHPGRLAGNIVLSRVQFRYLAEGPLVLNDVSLEIQPGEFVAFVGPSGCGKSTLMRLLLGFERPTAGTISYDGQDLYQLDARAVRQQLGVVLQESRLLPTEIYRNIVGHSSRSVDEAWEAAEMAGLAEDIRQMPMGMHTLVSEGGGTFSGGQRQRLLIARALVHKPRILFFDEATSALDNRTQAVVTQSMDRLDATRVVIAHRLSTVVNADRIFYLENGQIQEQGSYSELMARRGPFARMAQRQIA